MQLQKPVALLAVSCHDFASGFTGNVEMSSSKRFSFLLQFVLLATAAKVLSLVSFEIHIFYAFLLSQINLWWVGEGLGLI